MKNKILLTTIFSFGIISNAMAGLSDTELNLFERVCTYNGIGDSTKKSDALNKAINVLIEILNGESDLKIKKKDFEKALNYGPKGKKVWNVLKDNGLLRIRYAGRLYVKDRSNHTFDIGVKVVEDKNRRSFSDQDGNLKVSLLYSRYDLFADLSKYRQTVFNQICKCYNSNSLEDRITKMKELLNKAIYILYCKTCLDFKESLKSIDDYIDYIKELYNLLNSTKKDKNGRNIIAWGILKEWGMLKIKDGGIYYLYEDEMFPGNDIWMPLNVQFILDKDGKLKLPLLPFSKFGYYLKNVLGMMYKMPGMSMFLAGDWYPDFDIDNSAEYLSDILKQHIFTYSDRNDLIKSYIILGNTFKSTDKKKLSDFLKIIKDIGNSKMIKDMCNPKIIKDMRNHPELVLLFIKYIDPTRWIDNKFDFLQCLESIDKDIKNNFINRYENNKEDLIKHIEGLIKYSTKYILGIYDKDKIPPDTFAKIIANRIFPKPYEIKKEITKNN